MSDLRQQLNEARARHREAHYPGDLAAELLPRNSRRPFLPFASLLGALAAAVALIVWLHRPASTGLPRSAEPLASAVHHDRPARQRELALAVPPGGAGRRDAGALSDNALLNLPGITVIPALPDLPALPDITSLIPSYRDFGLPSVPDLLPTSLPDPIPNLLRSIPAWGEPRETPPSTRQAA